MKRAYIQNRFNRKSEQKIAWAIEIIDEYMQQGFCLTLRQLYYQFVARGLIPNSQSEYNKLGAFISNARLAGLIDWEAIEDRTRFLRTVPSWETPQDLLSAAAEQYKEDPWQDQECYLECWIEKDALIGVIEPVCRLLRIPYIACRGYMSQSEQWAASQRIIEREAAGKSCVVLHLGDHDPSGIDMTRDNKSRLWLFETEVHMLRLALNYDQVERYEPPPNPVKMTDSRKDGYVRKHGVSSWELDALEPAVIADLIQTAWSQYVNEDLWNDALEREKETREKLLNLSDKLE